MTIELRDLDAAKLARIFDDIHQRATAIATAHENGDCRHRAQPEPAALASPDVQRAIERASAGLGLRTARLPSGAGHDAQMMAQLEPDGDDLRAQRRAASAHSPKELTRWEDCANGANVLLASVLSIDSV